MRKGGRKTPPVVWAVRLAVILAVLMVPVLVVFARPGGTRGDAATPRPVATAGQGEQTAAPSEQREARATATVVARPTALPDQSARGGPASDIEPAPPQQPRTLPLREAPVPVIDARAAYLLYVNGDQVLFEKDANEPLSMASTTKIMTALLAIEHGDLKARIRVSHDAATIGESSMFLQEGEVVSLEQLLYGLMLPSGNDAAISIAELIGGSQRKFVAMMNTRAAELGMRQTRYANPYGFDDPGHYTTAHDLAIVARELLKHPELARVVGTDRYLVPEGAENKRHDLDSVNFPIKWYPGANGVKPGWTDEAGRCQVVSATRDGQTLIAVLLNVPSMWTDVRDLLDYGFARLGLPPSQNVALTPSEGLAGNLRDLWHGFKGTFIDENGRVGVKGGETTSAMQGETLLRAVWMDDRETFDRVARWTETRLSRANAVPGNPYQDSLYAAGWSEGTGAVTTWNNRTEGDELIGAAYAFAYRRWGDETYLARAQAIVKDLWNRVALIALDEVYFPADGATRWNNPSRIYLPGLHPAFYRIFAEIAGDSRWLSLYYTYYEMLLKRTTANGLPMKDVILDHNGQTALGDDPIFDEETSKTLWNAAIDFAWFGEKRAREFLVGMSPFVQQQWERTAGGMRARYNHDGSEATSTPSLGMAGTLLSAPTILDGKFAHQVIDRLLSDAHPVPSGGTILGAPDDYFGNTWAWMSLALANGAAQNLWETNTQPQSALEGRHWQYFPATKHSLRGGFLKFWQANGAEEIFGLPLTEERQEDGVTVQYFQRARLEYHPENTDAVGKVQLTLLGALLTKGKAPFQSASLAASTPERQFFPETGHSIGGPFQDFFVQKGGLTIFGFPISEEVTENGRQVQYFERARMELERAVDGKERIVLGLLGAEYLKARDGAGATP